ncbi:hypothetical protein MNV49_005378 [Pseudohyphozyma bogoriensis]|nr:hypothetical protein MNV49_005378 [Pseudohyphozyma bogoriensis]
MFVVTNPLPASVPIAWNSVTACPPSRPLDPTKPNLVLLHGMFASASSFSAQFSDPRLEATFNLIAFDCVLHGRTTSAESETVSVQDMADLYISALDELDLDAYTVVGETFMGSRCAAWIALKRPKETNGIVLVSPGMPAPQMKYQKGREMGLEMACRNKDGKGDGTGTIPDDILRAVNGTGHSSHDLAHLVHLYDCPTTEEIQSISCPVLILQGDQDEMDNAIGHAEAWRDLLINARGGADLRILAGAPYYLMFVEFNIANRIILSFHQLPNPLATMTTAYNNNITTTHHGALDGAAAGGLAGHSAHHGHTGRDAAIGAGAGHLAENHHEHHAAHHGAPGSTTTTTTTTTKPSVGQKIAGNAEVLVGKATHNPAKIQEGEIKKTGGVGGAGVGGGAYGAGGAAY